ncbi:MAG TPA: LPS assembly protein LptD [Candidatus Acidoferrales bacterium]|nr:LPS assembly protein LptD [Candidatus Acidoferrales bacterium]
MSNATFLQIVRRRVIPTVLLQILLTMPFPVFGQANGQIPRRPFASSGEATLEADQQREVGKIFYADGHVDVRYQNARLRADHVEYNGETQVIVAQGHVQLDYLTQHVEADDARYELRTGHGIFHHVRATFAVQRRPTPTLLTSPNPLYFEAEVAERLDENTYRIKKAWLTVCKPNRPVWKFYAPEATVKLRKSIHLENGNFRLFSVPILYLPFATFPAEKQRNSGFVVPEPGESSTKGIVFGDAFYWAPTDWMDATIGGSYYSKRGWSQKGELRMRPWQNARLDASYFGVIDRGLAEPSGPPLKQGGHEDRLLFTALLPHGWRAVADLDQLSSLTFRLAFSETFAEAVNSEVRNTAFLTNNFRGFSINLAALSYENFLSAAPQTAVTLRTAPEVRFSSVDQQFFKHIPAYFSFDAFTGGEHRGETVTPFETPGFVQRSEFAPSVTLPLHWGSWLSVTPSFTFRSTLYGGQLQNGAFLDRGLTRNTEEISVDIRPPTIERVWGDSGTKWKHVIEPEIVYQYVNGVNQFGRFVRFDEDETLTDTNEFEYGFTQRLFRRTGRGSADELLTWRIVQKYFLDPTFGGALVPGQRNVFQTLDLLTPFAFVDTPQSFSPIVSDLTIEPGKRYDTQFIVNYDPVRNRLSAIGTLLKLKPYKESFLTLAHFSTLNLPFNLLPPPPNFEQRSNQIRALLGYGDMNRRGWNVSLGASYDLTQSEFQNQIAELSYNASCCGIGFEVRRFSFGTIRNENLYMGMFRIANLGSFGNLRRQEKIF